MAASLKERVKSNMVLLLSERHSNVLGYNKIRNLAAQINSHVHVIMLVE